MPQLQCPTCHQPIEPDDRFCSACGAKISASTPNKQVPSATEAGARTQSSASQRTGSTTRSGWHEYKNVWYGFTVEKPVDWGVRTTDAVITISPDREGYLGAVIRPLQLQQPVSAETVARSLVGSMRKVLSSLSAWNEPPKEGIPSVEDTLSMRFQATYNNIPIEGAFLVQVGGKSALITGFQAPVSSLQKFAPAFQHILSSLRFIERLPLQQYVESNERAFSGSVPKGWHVRAVLQRTPDNLRIPLTEFRATDPGGTVSLTILPQFEQYTENPMMAMSFGPIHYMPPMPATHYLQRVLMPRVLQRYRDASVEHIVPYPDLAQYATMQAAKNDKFGLGTVCDVASVQYTFSQNGARYREKDFVQIDRIRNVGTWTARVTAQLCAPSNVFEAQEPILVGIIEAIQPNAQWEKTEQARSDQVFTNARSRLANVQQQYATSLQNLQHVQMDIAKDMREHTNRRIEAFSAIQEDMHDIIVGQRNVADPVSGKVYKLDVGYEAYWAGDGYIYGNHNVNQAPKLGLHRLDPL